MTLETAGDVNADGVPDVVATGGGKANVYSGRDGARILDARIRRATLPIGAAVDVRET